MIRDSEFLRLFIYVLAGYRLVIFINYDNGPADVMDWFRSRLGIKAEMVNGKIERWSDTQLGSMILCPYCLAFWIAAALTLVWLLALAEADVIIFWLGLWGAITYLLERSKLRL